MTKVVFLNHSCGLGAFTGSRRAKEDIIFHLFVKLFRCIGIEHIDIPVVSSDLIVIQTEAYDKSIRNLHSDIIELHVFLIDFRLEKHGADLHIRSALAPYNVHKVNDRIASIDDILDDNHSLALHTSAQAHDLAHLAGRTDPVIRSQLHGNQLHIELESLQKFTSEHYGAVQDTQDNRDIGTSFKICIDPGGDAIDSRNDPVIRQIRLENLVVKYDTIAHLLQYWFLELTNLQNILHIPISFHMTEKAYICAIF